MSHIFDALQRSEVERSGAEADSAATATELLKRAEQQAMRQWEAEAAPGNAAEPRLTNHEAAAADSISAAGLAAGLRSIPEAARGDGFATVCDQFRVAESSPAEENRIVMLTDKKSPAAEAFHLLKVRLRHRRRDIRLKTVLITSTAPEEGKSFAAANVACSLASGSKEKILLLEGDLRRPTQSRLFGVKVESGLCDYLQDRSSLPLSIYRLEGPGIWLLPAGNPPSDPLELIQSVKLAAAVGQLAEWFDWVIIDSPPALPLADATALARLADGIILVARRGISEKRKLQKGLDTFEANKLIGVILNSSNSEVNADYYYYGHRALPEMAGGEPD